uniref:Putative secreted salivary protein n=1 Tax=Xenopsylla cheopis TaxID=163159 RepID=A2IAA6_XENCH|nr:putative secreted salivary protein [Xenopsylla cheopis]
MKLWVLLCITLMVLQCAFAAKKYSDCVKKNDQHRIPGLCKENPSDCTNTKCDTVCRKPKAKCGTGADKDNCLCN